MSTPLARSSRTPAGPVTAPTRQQLDELDALLQRMLDLPVNPDEELPAESRSPEPPRPAVAAPPPPPRPRVAPRPEEIRPVVPPRAETQPVDPPAPPPPAPPPPAPPPPRKAQPRPETPASRPTGRIYPASYMVVETSTPSYLNREEPPPDPPALHADLGPRRVSAPEPSPREHEFAYDPPVPGGRHDLVADEPVDPAEELARLQAELDAPPEEWVPFQSSWQPSEQTWKPLAQTWEQARTTPASAPPPPPERSPYEMPALRQPPPSPPMPPLRELSAPPSPAGPSVMTQTAPDEAPEPPEPVVRRPSAPSSDAAPNTPVRQTPSQPETAAPTHSLVLLPLVWFNGAFDLFLVPWGRPGQWLKGEGGRSVLGALGLLCLAGAVVLGFIDGFGWTW